MAVDRDGDRHGYEPGGDRARYLIAAGVVLVLAVLMGGAAALGAASRDFQMDSSAGCVVLVGGGVLAAILGVAYLLSKKMALFVESAGGTTFGLVFKRSVIEGVPVDIDKVKALVDIIRELIITCQQRV